MNPDTCVTAIAFEQALQSAKAVLATACDIQLCGILTSVVSDKRVQLSFKLTNSKCSSLSSLTLIE